MMLKLLAGVEDHLRNMLLEKVSVEIHLLTGREFYLKVQINTLNVILMQTEQAVELKE